MARKKSRPTTDKGFPVDDRPVIFNLIDTKDINFVGRYIESESMFMLSINDNQSDFVPQADVDEWWYIDEHPTIISEVLTKKSLKKDKKEDKPKYKRNSKDKENDTQTFSAPPFPPLPPFLKGFVEHLQERMGMPFEQVNVRVVGEDELSDLPNEVLEQLLEKAVADENFELATKVRDIIKNKKNESA
jgi:hypothetical protein